MKLLSRLARLALISFLALGTISTSVSAEPTYAPGTTTVKDSSSPSGYTVHFVFDAKNIDKTKEIKSVSVTGPFLYVDPSQDLKDKDNAYGPEQYKNGMYATNCAPGPFSWGYTKEMTLNTTTGYYETSFPITSGSFAYSYVITYSDDTSVTMDDPANPSPAKKNPYSTSATGDLAHSIAYGHYDSVKQSKSLNLDYVIPTGGNRGSLSYVPYTAVDGTTQYIGIYVPNGYSATGEPYKVIYASHGGGGNETDWFAMGHVDNIMDNLINAGSIEKAIVVTMDNNYFAWDFAKIEENVLSNVIPYVETHYNVVKDASGRAFCGLSMGGMTTTHFFFDHPEAFAYFGVFSGSDISAVTENPLLTAPTVMASVGTCDMASEKIMAGEGIKYEDLVRYMEAHKDVKFKDIGYLYGSHDWFVWSQSFNKFASAFLAKKTATESKTPAASETKVTPTSNTSAIKNTASQPMSALLLVALVGCLVAFMKKED